MDMSGQPRLFDAPVDSVSVQMAFTYREGWQMTVNWRRHGDTWDQEPPSWYDSLDPAELIDALTGELWSLLIDRRPSSS